MTNILLKELGNKATSEAFCNLMKNIFIEKESDIKKFFSASVSTTGYNGIVCLCKQCGRDEIKDV